MEKSSQKLRLILLMITCMVENSIASRINPQLYEEASNDSRYRNACVVRSYRDTLLLHQGNGTLCEHKGVKFILTTSEIIKGNSYTVLFDGEGENAITFPETLDLTSRYGYKRSKIAISFMYIYPPGTTPAQIDESADFNHSPETHVVGYAHALLPKSSPDLVFFNADGATSKRILVPFNPKPILQTIDANNVANPDLKSVTGQSSDVFKGFELPLPPGIMGAAIRTQEGNVAGVALGSTPYWCTEKYLELHPIKYRLLHMANAFVKNIQNRFSFSTLTFGILLSQAAFTYSPSLGIASYCVMGAAACLSQRLPLLTETWRHYTFPAGSENYGLQLLPWMTDLEIKLNTHHQKRMMAYR
ncbi:MAG: hypothetical protein K2X53_01530 [Alphaproteobacteria bacterium]|nr:hypothetical protein [Alphaproteobacteria bacterium]